jgi:hypothetical protein
MVSPSADPPEFSLGEMTPRSYCSAIMSTKSGCFKQSREWARLQCAAIDTIAVIPFDARVVKISLALFFLALVGCVETLPKPYQVPAPKPLPIALNADFAFRKTKLYFLDPAPKPIVGLQDASIIFERQYRLDGAITGLDQRQRFGDYFDFFWRARRDADVTVRFEYRQAKLHAFVQAREARYPHARGHHKTEFAIIGDDYFEDGGVIAWRASLIMDGRMVAMTRSYLWE